MNYFEEKNWYKGNIHSHSTISDGELTPAQLVSEYKQRGYNFMVISEHRIYSNYEDFFDSDDFILLAGIEHDTEISSSERNFHIHGILNAHTPYEIPHLKELEKPKWVNRSTPQKMIDMLKKSGNITILNHPDWSLIELGDYLGLQNIDGVEIYNSGSDVYSNNGYSLKAWDELLRRGKKVFGVAADDNHNSFPFDHPLNDSFLGYIVVNANELTREAITSAILKGNFYSSQGPEIYAYGIEDDEVYVKCSPACMINFVSYPTNYAPCISRETQDTLTEGRFKLKGNETYIRVEIKTTDNKTAFSNPIYFNN